jgi:hypothetical protein
LSFSLHGNSKPNPASFGKSQGLARAKRKRKGNARIWRVKKRKNSTAKFGALQQQKINFCVLGQNNLAIKNQFTSQPQQATLTGNY